MILTMAGAGFKWLARQHAQGERRQERSHDDIEAGAGERADPLHFSESQDAGQPTHEVVEHHVEG